MCVCVYLEDIMVIPLYAQEISITLSCNVNAHAISFLLLLPRAVWFFSLHTLSPCATRDLLHFFWVASKNRDSRTHLVNFVFIVSFTALTTRVCSSILERLFRIPTRGEIVGHKHFFRTKSKKKWNKNKTSLA